MAAFADLSELINRATGGNSGTPETIWWHKNGRIAGVAAPAAIAGRWMSLWLHDGSPSAGVAPGAVAAPDNATTGGFKQADPGGGRQKWLFGAGAATLSQGTLLLYDRLLHISGLSGTSASAQTVGGSLTRYTDGTGNIAWVEIYTQIGTTARTVTMSYTDPVNGAGRTSQAALIGGTAFNERTRAIMLPLADGDKGVSAVASITLSGTTGTAGDIGVTVAHPLLQIPCPVIGAGGMRDVIAGLPSLVEIKTDACLAMAWLPNQTAIPEFFGWLPMAER